MPWLAQRHTSLVSVCICAGLFLALSACGGGQQPPHGAPDTSAPTFQSASATKPTPDRVRVSATATDDGSVSGYCAKATATTPSAGDACFTNAQPIDVDISGLTTNAKVYVWARDANNNVSSARVVDVNQCSESGQATAAASSYAKVVCLGVGAINGSHSGEILIGLEPNAPNSTANFLSYVNAGFYPGTVFHRVISNFMIQTGGNTYASGVYTQKSAGLLPAIALERTSTTGLSNIQYSVALARTNVADSATSQFFINVVNNPQLDANGAIDPGNGYAVFGKVISGTDIIDLIKAVPVAANSSNEVSQPTGTPPTILYTVSVKP